MPQQEWDQNGKPVGTLASRTPTEWDENGKPIIQSAEQQSIASLPNAGQQSKTQLMNRIQPMSDTPGTLDYSVRHGYREAAEDPEAQQKGAEIGGYMGMAGGVGGGVRAIADKGIRAAAGPIIKGVTGAVAGSAAGGYGGRQIGTAVGGKGGGDTGAQVGSTLGALGGGLYGGMGLNEPIPEPESFPVSKSPGPYRGPASLPKPMPEPTVVPASQSPGPYRGPTTTPDPVTVAVKQGLASRVPTKMPAPQVGSVSEGPGPYTGPSSVPKPVPEPNVIPVSQSPGAYRGPSQVALSQRVAANADAAAREAIPVSQGPGPYTGPQSVPPNVQPVSEAPGGYRGPASVPRPAKQIPVQSPPATATLSSAPGLTPSTLPPPGGEGTSTGLPPGMPVASPDMPLAARTGQSVTGGAQQPFEPLVYADPYEAAQGDFRAANLQRQASRAGLFSAAQGKTGQPLNYQQRIGAEAGTAPPLMDQYPPPRSITPAPSPSPSLEGRIPPPDNPTLSQRTGIRAGGGVQPEGESRMEQLRRGASGENPTVKSVKRHYKKENQ
jgi:hypothetical protein